MRLPPLKSLPVFEAVARLNSFSAAATELSVSQSAISHQIKQLETWLGERLFNRQGRRLMLTEEGRLYLDAIGSALLQIERASDQVLGQEQSQLRLSVFSSFAVRWLVPRLPALQRQHPWLDLVLEMANVETPLTDRIADGFITIHQESSAYSYERLYTERLFPVCSQEYWLRLCRELGRPSALPETSVAPLRPDELAEFTHLSTHSIYNRAGGDWEAWYAAAGQELPERSRVQHFSHMLLALEAARHHQGIALTNDYMLPADASPDHQRQGTHPGAGEGFVRIPTHAVTTGDQFYFAWKTARRREQGIRVLRQWLLEEAVATGLREPG